MHAYDKNAQYLAACSAVELGLAGAEHVQAPAFDPKLPGYWRVPRDQLAWQAPLLPDFFNPVGRSRSAREVWVSTPTLAYGRELGYDVDPVDAYVHREHGRALEPWYQRLRDARAALVDAATDPDAAAVLVALKRTYAGGIGRLGAAAAQGHRRYRPDHRHAIIATARANLTRNLRTIADRDGRWPLAVYRDCLLYASDDPDPLTAAPPALRLGPGPGAFKPAGTAAMVDLLPLLSQGTRPDRAGNLDPFRRIPTEPVAGFQINSIDELSFDRHRW